MRAWLTTSGLAYRHNVGLLAGAVLAVAICGAPAFSQRAAAQSNVWWDTNGFSTAGAGATPTGTWDINGNNKVWNSDSGGLGANNTLKPWTNGNNAFFSAGSDAVNAFTVTVSAGVTVNNITFEEGTPTIAGATLTLTGTTSSTSTITTTTSGTISASLAGTGVNLAKAGTATLTLSGNDTYSGTTAINVGTLKIDNNNSTTAGKLANTTGITINSGGTLLLSGSSSVTDRINNGATMTLAGGTFNTGGLTEAGGSTGTRTAGIGALTLTANSTIDFGTGSSIIEFAGLGPHTPITGADLAITNWTGTPYTAGGTDQLLFAGTTTDFTAKFDQSDVSFNGVQGYSAIQIAAGYYEIVEVPEPGTWVAAGLSLIVIAYSQRRRFARAVKRVG